VNIKEVNIPKTAGCYLFKNEKDQIIYVGKSKFLPKRVTSYFQKNHKDQKTGRLVTEIKSVDFISTDSENEALVLEEDLIKLYKPKFNIKGKDDKTLHINLVLTKEEWPKLDLYYPKEECDGDTIYQFTSVSVARQVLEIISDLFQIRSCSYNITSEGVEKEKFKACLEWHLGRCVAPCVGGAKKLDYLFQLKMIKDIFTNGAKTTVKTFTKKMKWYSTHLEFEKAHEVKEKIDGVKKILTLIKPTETILRRKRCEELKELLGLKFVPLTIDAIDNSHTAGTGAVSGLVRFVLLKPEKSEYRKFINKSDTGGDDWGSFEELIFRRFKRLIDENKTLPNLLIIDGARAHLNLAIRELDKLGISDKLDVIAISKDDKHKANLIHTLDKDISIRGFSELAKISDEVHRFSIEFHRSRRSKDLFNKNK
jgi:excinuclease ABC subunit C